MNIEIRPEDKNDFDEIHELIIDAFKSAEHTDGNEQNLVKKIRQSDEYIGDLSLLAIADNKIIGHIMFSELKLGDKRAVALAPLSVQPEFQRMGVGRALISRAHEIATGQGYDFSIVLGSDLYYSKMGYIPASQFGIRSPFDIDDKYYMAINFKGDNKKINETPIYSAAFN